MRYLLLMLSSVFIQGVACGQASVSPSQASTYKLYAGLAASVQSYQIISPIGTIRYLKRVGIYPLYGYAGYQLTPYLAAQVGFSRYSPADINYRDKGVLPDGQMYENSDLRRQYDWALPILLRYRFTRHLNHKLHTGGLFGFTTQFHQYYREVQFVVNGQTTFYNLENNRDSNRFVTAGLTIGYTIGKHLDLTTEAAGSINFELFRFTGKPNSPTQITPTLNLGLRYFFVRKRPITTS